LRGRGGEREASNSLRKREEKEERGGPIPVYTDQGKGGYEWTVRPKWKVECERRVASYLPRNRTGRRKRGEKNVVILSSLERKNGGLRLASEKEEGEGPISKRGESFSSSWGGRVMVIAKKKKKKKRGLLYLFVYVREGRERGGREERPLLLFRWGELVKKASP